MYDIHMVLIKMCRYLNYKDLGEGIKNYYYTIAGVLYDIKSFKSGKNI